MITLSHVTTLHDLSALEQAAAIRSGELNPRELVSHYADRIDRLDGDLGAFITVTAEAAAEAAGHRLAGGRDDLSPLFGVPTAIKDLTATAGIRTTLGSRAYAGYVPDTDAHLVTRLRAAGMISLGKTNTPEFGICRPAPRLTWHAARAARAAALPPRSRPGWSRSPTAVTAAARCEFPLACAVSSG
jgi:Asp-tRNA(Asn)/Glu-tRNA(Gln) amidotransferase A subunit family amidase